MTPKAAAPREVLRRFAPGTALRDTAELIFRQGTGALIVIGAGERVDAVSSGGFELDSARFSPQRVAELAKMDGGIVIDIDSGSIVRANVHFIPDPSLDTDETGTRFRTADRLARQTRLPVLAVSEEGISVAVVFTPDGRFVLQSPTTLLAEANQRLQALGRLRAQLDEGIERLTGLEVDDVVVTLDPVIVIQRAALILRLMDSLDITALELGDEAPLIGIQAMNLIEGVGATAELVNYDYQPRKPRKGSSVLTKLDRMPVDDLYHSARVAAALGLPPLDQHVVPRGVRALSGVPRLPDGVRDDLVRRFGDFQRLRAASVQELSSVDGVGRARARQIRTYLDRLDEAGSLLDFEE